MSHILRSAAGLTTTNASGFIIARKLAQVGAAVSASGDREFIYYTLEVSFTRSVSTVTHTYTHFPTSKVILSSLLDLSITYL